MTPIKTMKAVNDLLDNTRLGIKPEAARGIRQLYDYLLFKHKLDDDVRERWQLVGRLLSNGEVRMDKSAFKNLALELVLEGLEYVGTAEYTAAMKVRADA